MRTWTPSSVRVNELETTSTKSSDVDLIESEPILALQRQHLRCCPVRLALASTSQLAHHLENDLAWEKAKAFWREEQSYRQSGYTPGSTTPPLVHGRRRDKHAKEAPAQAQAQAVRLIDRTNCTLLWLWPLGTHCQILSSCAGCWCGCGVRRSLCWAWWWSRL